MKEMFRAFGVVAGTLTLVFLMLYNGMGIAASVWLSRWTDDALLKNMSIANSTQYKEQTVFYVGVFAACGVLQGESNVYYCKWME
jgi:hypothetical protein